jgi:hypothetical protein
MKWLCDKIAGLELYIALAAIVLLLGALAAYGNGRYKAGLAKGRAEIQAAWDKDKARQMAAAQAHNAAADKISADVGAKAEAAQVRIETRYRTLIQKVPQHVPPNADPVVPAALVRLLDEAAAGDDPDAISFAAGRSLEAGAPVKLGSLATVVIGNYGVATANARQLTDLQDWVRRQQANSPPR